MRQITVDIDCNNETCGNCGYRNIGHIYFFADVEGKNAMCTVFKKNLDGKTITVYEDEHPSMRCSECLMAEVNRIPSEDVLNNLEEI